MPRQQPSEAIKHARRWGAAKGVRGAVWRADPATLERYAAELPGLWEAVRSLVPLTDELHRRGGRWAGLRSTGPGVQLERLAADLVTAGRGPSWSVTGVNPQVTGP